MGIPLLDETRKTLNFSSCEKMERGAGRGKRIQTFCGKFSLDHSLPPHLGRSLCAQCLHHRQIVSGKGSIFLLCRAPSQPPNWPKYPPQPMISCPLFAAKLKPVLNSEHLHDEDSPPNPKPDEGEENRSAEDRVALPPPA